MAYMPYNNYEGQYMADFEVVFYEKEKGNQLREPYSKSIDDGIFEVRCKVGNNITRVLYFFYYEGKIVLTNGFVKKTQKIPPEEIKLAKERRADFKERMGKS
jgi:phage-related protein